VKEDAFPFSKILQAARGIRNRCLVGRPGHKPTIGREWIRPSQFVDVQFGGVFPRNVDGIKGNLSDTSEEDTNLTVYLADGSNLTFASNALGGTREYGSSIMRIGNGNPSTAQ